MMKFYDHCIRMRRLLAFQDKYGTLEVQDQTGGNHLHFVLSDSLLGHG